MSLTKIVDGVPVLCTPEEEAAILAEWTANTPSLAKRQAEAWERIKAERDRRLLTGGCQVGTDWFYTDLISRSQNLANARKADLIKQVLGNMSAVLLIGTSATPITTMAGVTLGVTATLAHAILASFEAQELATYTAAAVHQATMMASLTPETYDFSAGWPAVFVT